MQSIGIRVERVHPKQGNRDFGSIDRTGER